MWQFCNQETHVFFGEIAQKHGFQGKLVQIKQGLSLIGWPAKNDHRVNGIFFSWISTVDLKEF